MSAANDVVEVADDLHDELAQAQAELDRHPTASANGLCVACRTPGPCAAREAAAAVFVRYGLLPHRLAGATRPELVRARIVAR